MVDRAPVSKPGRWGEEGRDLFGKPRPGRRGRGVQWSPPPGIDRALPGRRASHPPPLLNLAEEGAPHFLRAEGDAPRCLFPRDCHGNRGGAATVGLCGA